MSSIATHTNLVLFQHERLNASDPAKFKQGNQIKQKKKISKKQFNASLALNCLGKSIQADEEIRTLDPLLGKEMLYH